MIIKIIGLGGIGSVLVDKISRFLNYSIKDDNVHMTLVDGDDYEAKNYERQEFFQLGNKAKIKATELTKRFEENEYEFIDNYVNSKNIPEIIKEGELVFLCVDNHKTRKLVSDYCESLNDITLISGGNELTDGNVQIFLRKGGKSLTPSLTDYHPEIANPDDKSPEEMSCEELEKVEPQLFFTNLTVATYMCWALYNVVIKDDFEVSEIYFDMAEMASDGKVRRPKQKAA